MRYSKMLLLILVLLSLTACGQQIDSNMSQNVQPFSYTNQDNETVTLESLKGEWWIADFVFTNCETVCPPMTNNMSILQDKLKDSKIDVELISFSVDPDRDTPETLKHFGNKFEANYQNWSFLTGYSFTEVKTFAMKSFKTLVKDIESTDQMMHSTSFYLVNPKGKAIKKYSGIQQGELDKIVKDLQKVQ